MAQFVNSVTWMLGVKVGQKTCHLLVDRLLYILTYLQAFTLSQNYSTNYFQFAVVPSQSAPQIDMEDSLIVRYLNETDRMILDDLQRQLENEEITLKGFNIRKAAIFDRYRLTSGLSSFEKSHYFKLLV